MMMFPQTNWYGVSRRDPRVVSLYSRHYSSKKNNKSRKEWAATGVTAPGETMTLLTADGTALFIWLKQQYVDNDQTGVNCAVFRNEGKCLSSELIKEACLLAWNRWPGERLYTYVDPGEVKSINPGYCFLMAGWNKCGHTKRLGLVILEKFPIEFGAVERC
jgi:hypothetical protein